jgi:hypothetical protein
VVTASAMPLQPAQAWGGPWGFNMFGMNVGQSWGPGWGHGPWGYPGWGYPGWGYPGWGGYPWGGWGYPGYLGGYPLVVVPSATASSN